MWLSNLLKISIGGVLLLACTSAPVIQYSALVGQDSTGLTEAHYNRETLSEKLAAVQGVRFADLIFKKNSTVYWITPEIDRLYLEITSKEEGFQPSEYRGRLRRIQEVHQEYLLFWVDLRLPFSPGLARDELLAYLKGNLTVMLKAGSELAFSAAHQTFETFDRFGVDGNRPGDANGREELEVEVPVRVLFRREQEDKPILSPEVSTVILKLSLSSNPPFRVSSVPDKYYHGYLWKIEGER